jgi:hypothetical protein
MVGASNPLLYALRVALVFDADLIHKLGINRQPLVQSDRPWRGVSPRVVYSHGDIHMAVVERCEKSELATKASTSGEVHSPHG